MQCDSSVVLEAKKSNFASASENLQGVFQMVGYIMFLDFAKQFEKLVALAAPAAGSVRRQRVAAVGFLINNNK